MATTKNLIIAVCISLMALCNVKGHPVSTGPSLMTQYLSEMCSFYVIEKDFPGITGCNQDVIEDVKEHGDNLQRPQKYIPNWDGNNVEVYLNMANRPNMVCSDHGASLKGACAVMEAVCISNLNVVPCSMVTATPPMTSSTTAPVTTTLTTTPTIMTTTSSSPTANTTV